MVAEWYQGISARITSVRSSIPLTSAQSPYQEYVSKYILLKVKLTGVRRRRLEFPNKWVKDSWSEPPQLPLIDLSLFQGSATRLEGPNAKFRQFLRHILTFPDFPHVPSSQPGQFSMVRNILYRCHTYCTTSFIFTFSTILAVSRDFSKRHFFQNPFSQIARFWEIRFSFGGAIRPFLLL